MLDEQFSFQNQDIYAESNAKTKILSLGGNGFILKKQGCKY